MKILTFREFLEESKENNLLENLDIKVHVDKKASHQKDGRYYVTTFRGVQSTIIPEMDDGVYFVVYQKRVTLSPPKVFTKVGRAWFDSNTKKQASKYLNDLFHILEREFHGDYFFDLNESALYDEIKQVLVKNDLTLDKNTVKQKGLIQGVLNKGNELSRADSVISFYSTFKELDKLKLAFEKEGFKTDTNLHSQGVNLTLKKR